MQNQKSTLSNGKSIVGNAVEQAKKLLTGPEDILTAIKEDHKPLKELIKIMKDENSSSIEVKQAFAQFAPLLITHAKAEEESLYAFMLTKKPLRTESFEGETEHGLADQLVELTKRTTGDEDKIRAQIKVLAELVEHHIDEEESAILPRVKEETSEAQRAQLLVKYTQIQSELIAAGQDDAPPESQIEEAHH